MHALVTSSKIVTDVAEALDLTTTDRGEGVHTLTTRRGPRSVNVTPTHDQHAIRVEFVTARGYFGIEEDWRHFSTARSAAAAIKLFLETGTI